jgi:hypothetical protein
MDTLRTRLFDAIDAVTAARVNYANASDALYSLNAKLDAIVEEAEQAAHPVEKPAVPVPVGVCRRIALIKLIREASIVAARQAVMAERKAPEETPIANVYGIGLREAKEMADAWIAEEVRSQQAWIEMGATK